MKMPEKQANHTRKSTIKALEEAYSQSPLTMSIAISSLAKAQTSKAWYKSAAAGLVLAIPTIPLFEVGAAFIGHFLHAPHPDQWILYASVAGPLVTSVPFTSMFERLFYRGLIRKAEKAASQIEVSRQVASSGVFAHSN